MKKKKKTSDSKAVNQKCSVRLLFSFSVLYAPSTQSYHIHAAFARAVSTQVDTRASIYRNSVHNSKIAFRPFAIFACQNVYGILMGDDAMNHRAILRHPINYWRDDVCSTLRVSLEFINCSVRFFSFCQMSVRAQFAWGHFAVTNPTIDIHRNHMFSSMYSFSHPELYFMRHIQMQPAHVHSNENWHKESSGEKRSLKISIGNESKTNVYLRERKTLRLDGSQLIYRIDCVRA